MATAAVSVECTHNFAGGTVLPVEDLRALRAWADGVDTRIHMDGARIWNAHVATGTPFAEYGAVADVMAVCLSKGLGAPIGSLMVGGRDAIGRPGCGASGSAAGCARSASSPRPACTPSTTTSSGWPTTTPTPGCSPRPAGSTPARWTPTSWSSTADDAARFVADAAEQGVRVAPVGPRAVRLVTHLDISADDARRAAAVLSRVAATPAG